MAKAKVKAQFRLRFIQGKTNALGPGKIALLEAIEKTGSISAAARHLGMSYRRAWLLVDDLNHCLRDPAVSREAGGKDGGNSKVTSTGKKLVQLYRGIERDAFVETQPDIHALSRMLAK